MKDNSTIIDLRQPGLVLDPLTRSREEARSACLQPR